MMAEILIKSFLEAAAVTALVYFFCFETKVAKWEQKQWAKFKRFIRRQLRKSKTIVAWAETPTKHGTPDDEWITGQIRVWGDVWQ